MTGKKRAGKGGAVNKDLRDFKASYRDADLLLDYFARAGCEIVTATRATSVLAKAIGSWALTIKLPTTVEYSHGLAGNVAVLCCAEDKLDISVVGQLRALIAGLGQPVEEHVGLLATRDTQAANRLGSWGLDQSHGVLAIPIVTRSIAGATVGGGVLREELSELLDQWLFERDLYDEKLPVSGGSFYGRARQQARLTHACKAGRHSGLFGLRKIGKTSLLQQVREELAQDDDVLPVYYDLEDSSGAGSAAHVAYELGTSMLPMIAARCHGDLEPRIRELMNLPQQWRQRPAMELVADFWDALRKLLEASDRLRIVLILDEIEILFSALQGREFQLASEFLRGLRGLSHRTARVSLVVAGVNSTPCERPRLGGGDNPLFNLLDLNYLGPLGQQECRQMIVQVGRRMGLRWSFKLADVLVDDVGGHPFLARLAASDVAAETPNRPNPVAQEAVSAALRDFHTRRSATFREMVQMLRGYYEDEYELLRMIASGEHDFVAAWRAAHPEEVSHLVGYGVVSKDTKSIEIPALKRWLLTHGD